MANERWLREKLRGLKGFIEHDFDEGVGRPIRASELRTIWNMAADMFRQSPTHTDITEVVGSALYRVMESARSKTPDQLRGLPRWKTKGPDGSNRTTYALPDGRYVERYEDWMGFWHTTLRPPKKIRIVKFWRQKNG